MQQVGAIVIFFERHKEGDICLFLELSSQKYLSYRKWMQRFFFTFRPYFIHEEDKPFNSHVFFSNENLPFAHKSNFLYCQNIPILPQNLSPKTRSFSQKIASLLRLRGFARKLKKWQNQSFKTIFKLFSDSSQLVCRDRQFANLQLIPSMYLLLFYEDNILLFQLCLTI